MDEIPNLKSVNFRVHNKIKISSGFRSKLAGKLMDLGNLTAAAFIFGLFINEKEFSPSLLFFGIFFILSCYLVSLIISE